MSKLKSIVYFKAKRIVENRNYKDPQYAFKDCVNGTVDLVSELKEITSFVVEVQVSQDFEGTPWENKGYEGVWHCVVAVPDVGIVDITGSQFGKQPLRVMNVVPEDWKVVRRIERSPYAPKKVCEWMDIGSDNNSYDPTEVFRELLNVNQKFSSEHG